MLPMYYDQSLDYLEISIKKVPQKTEVFISEETIVFKDGEIIVGYGFYNAQENIKQTTLLDEESKKQALKFMSLLKKWRV